MAHGHCLGYCSKLMGCRGQYIIHEVEMTAGKSNFYYTFFFFLAQILSQERGARVRPKSPVLRGVLYSRAQTVYRSEWDDLSSGKGEACASHTGLCIVCVFDHVKLQCWMEKHINTIINQRHLYSSRWNAMPEHLRDSSAEVLPSPWQLNWLALFQESRKEHFLPSEIFKDPSESDRVVFQP